MNERIAFSSVARLIEAIGPGQHWIRIDVAAMKAMLAPVGVVHVQIDPVAVGARLVRPRVADGRARLIIRRETDEDLLRRDVG